jgi:lysophospholipase L1-like esterase
MSSPYNGTVVGTPTFPTASSVSSTLNAANFGHCVTLNGTSQYIDLSSNIPPSMNPLGGTGWTQECRVQTTSSTGVCVAFGAGDGTHDWFLGIDTGAAVFGLGGNTVVYQRYSAINDGAWHVLRMVYSGTSVYFYVDGVLQNAGGTAVTWLQVGTAHAYIGAFWSGSAVANFFPGSVDECISFSAALSTGSTYTLPTTPYANTVANGVALYHLESNGTDSYGSGTLAASPTSIVQGSTSNVITLTGTGTAWTAGTPGSPTFTLSGGTGASITAQSVASATSATITVTAGSATGPLTITDPGTGATATITVASGTVTIGPPVPSAPAQTTLTLTAPAATGGTGSYTYAWYRSTTSNFTPGGGTLISGATALVLNDTGLSPATVYYYIIKATDTGSNVGFSAQVTAVTTAAAALVLGLIGDSIMAGTGPADPTQIPAVGLVTRLASEGGWRVVSAVNRGIVGTTSANWVVGGSDYPAAATAFTSAGAAWTIILLGANDAKTTVATSAAAYHTNIAGVVSAEVAAGRKVLLIGPSYIVPGSFGLFDVSSLTLLQAYGAQLHTLVDNLHVFAGPIEDMYAYFAANQGELTDGLHPTNTGGNSMASLWERYFRLAAGIAPSGGGGGFLLTSLNGGF